MSRRVFAIALTTTLGTIALAVIGNAAIAQQPSIGPQVDKVFARFNGNSPGCAVGVAKDDQTLYTHGYGMANLEYRVPLTDTTVLESGSVAKQFTASAIELLALDGKLALDDDIRKYLPEVPNFGPTITIRNLLTHTSGLRDQWGLLGIEGRGPGSQVHSTATTLDLVAHQRMLNFTPGSEYLYSNTGYALAAIIVERVTGQSFQEFTQARLFRPLGMTHTQWRDDFTRVVPNRATAYSESNGEFHQDMPFTNMIGNGGLLSTMADLLKWNANLDRGTVGGKPYIDAMQTQMRLTNHRTISYALGLTVSNYRGVREVSHDGSTAGYRTYLGRFPEQHVSIAVWCNHASANAGALGHQVADVVLTHPAESAQMATATHADLANPRAAYQRWAGIYRNASTDQAMTFTLAGDSLRTTLANGRTAKWLPVENDHFVSPLGDVRFSGAVGHRTALLISPAARDTTTLTEALRATTIPVSDYVGTYVSDELDARFEIVAHGDTLVLTRRPADEFSLTPVYVDDFQASGGLGSMRFVRDARGNITGFSFFAGRVRDVRFKRVASSKK
jgi:CubicO group peptidase (beta-lactamase class C family)